jgi:hypothetical protein
LGCAGQRGLRSKGDQEGDESVAESKWGNKWFAHNKVVNVAFTLRASARLAAPTSLISCPCCCWRLNTKHHTRIASRYSFDFGHALCTHRRVFIWRAFRNQLFWLRIFFLSQAEPGRGDGKLAWVAGWSPLTTKSPTSCSL